MTLPSYPSELPPPRQQDYQLASGDGRTVSREDAGPPNVRRRFSAVANMVAFSTLLDRSELARFDRFYTEDTKQGTLPFLIPDPGTDGWPLLDDEGTPLLTDDGTAILAAATWVCLFGAQLPVRRAAGGLFWEVSFQLSVLP